MHLIDEVSGADERPSTLEKIVGCLNVVGGVGPTITEANDMANHILSLLANGNSMTKKYMLAVMTQSMQRQRCKEVVATMDTTVNMPFVLGEYVFKSRRADFSALVAGKNLIPNLGYVRLKREDILNALTFIENNCDLSWRNGHIVTRTIGTIKVELPRLKRHLTIGFLCGEYASWCRDQSVGALGRQIFSFILRLITVEVQEVTGASYYYTDGVIESFSMINQLLTRLKVICADHLSSGKPMFESN
jgi:hypothetical protein